MIVHRLALVVAEDFPSRFASISIYTDSMSSIGAMSKAGGVLRPFFANHVYLKSRRLGKASRSSAMTSLGFNMSLAASILRTLGHVDKLDC